VPVPGRPEEASQVTWHAGRLPARQLRDISRLLLLIT
jgi:hypothetical protein